VSVRPLEPSALLAEAARARARRGDLRLPAPDRLGAAAGRRCDRLLPLDGLESAQAGRHLALSADEARRHARCLEERGERPCPAEARAPPGRQHRDGVDIVHAIVDDHSRLAYAEIHDDQRATTVVGFFSRALTFYASHGISAKRLMTDNGWQYGRSRDLRRLLAQHQIRHLKTQPYRPRTNGKVERFHQTMAREWAYGLLYRSHHERANALPHWLNHYNTHRPHSSLGGAPPISRIHNVCGQDI